MVVLDIGGDVGALVVSAPAELAGAEIEICPAGRRRDVPDEGGTWWQGEWRSHSHSSAHIEYAQRAAWPHVAVLARRTPAVTGFAAVYPGLHEGDYEVWVAPDQPTRLVVSVLGGAVTMADWPEGAIAAPDMHPVR
jgi:hypothetical protein